MPFKEWEFRVDAITAEDERVVVEVVSRGRGPGPMVYGNEYMMRMTVDDGVITDFRENGDAYGVEILFESGEKWKEENGQL